MILLNLLGISEAYAATGTTQSQGGFLSMLPMLVILVAFMYFAVIRPQSKRAKDHRNLMGSLKVGDEVVTTGGILGKISKIAENFIVLELAKDTSISIQKNAIAATLPKGTIKSI
ncbi:MAG: preprotein translocase subunit YajC [Gammaproteobacteria bacterium]|nr:preprotein translocase subunit YajC [Gammaproteobacteria bacterium]